MRHEVALFDRVPEDLRKRYCKTSDSKVFGDANSTDKRRQALQQVGEDMAAVLSLFGETDPVREWDIFLQLRKIFNQQCEVREEFIEIRKKTGGNVIVNPSDPDATYDGHKGAGYQVQISETVNEDGEANLITAAIVETAVTSDADAVEPIVEDLMVRGHVPDEMTADAGYGGHDNVEFAKAKGITLTAPVPGGKQFDPDEVGYDQFEVNDAGEVTACPAGHAPRSTRYNEKNDHTWAQMNPGLCSVCQLVEQCRVQKDKNTGQANGRVQFRSDAPEAARRRRHEQTDAYRDVYRWRSGIEATNSCLKRCLGLGRLRVRAMKAVKLSVMLKLAAWNILRGTVLRNHRMIGPCSCVRD